MSEWVDVAVYAVFIVAVWGWLAVWAPRVMILAIADRNPGWLTDHPQIGRRLSESRWFRWSCLLWGSVSVVALLALQTGAWPQPLAFARVRPEWEALKNVNSALLIAGLIYLAGCAALFYRWLHAHVPRSSRRQATLERRSLHDYVPPSFQYAVYGVIVLHLATWVAVGVTGRYATPAFWGTALFQFAISGAFLLFMLNAVRRRPGTWDRMFGSGYRRTEVRGAFVVQLLPLLSGVARLSEQVAGASSEQVDRFLHLGVVLLVVAFVVGLAGWSRKSGEPGPAPWRRSATSAVVIAFVAFVTMHHV
jgi:hypothetical protein